MIIIKTRGALYITLASFTLLNINCKENKMELYKFKDSNVQESINYKVVDTNHVEFTFEHSDLKNKEKSFNLIGVAENIDPEGGAAFDEFDPSGEGNPIEIYSWEKDGKKFQILIPIVEANYVGIEYFEKDKMLFDRMLKK